MEIFESLGETNPSLLPFCTVVLKHTWLLWLIDGGLVVEVWEILLFTVFQETIHQSKVSQVICLKFPKQMPQPGLSASMGMSGWITRWGQDGAFAGARPRQVTNGIDRLRDIGADWTASPSHSPLLFASLCQSIQAGRLTAASRWAWQTSALVLGITLSATNVIPQPAHARRLLTCHFVFFQEDWNYFGPFWATLKWDAWL